jgi:signal transduction protein with GAF and PtsI domain
VAEALTEALASFAREMATPYDPDELLHQLVIRATAILEAAGAGIMLADDDGELRYVAATDDRVVAAEQHQDRVRDGVCFEAYTTGRPLAVADLLEDADRWPAYAEGVLNLGFRAVLGIPMRGAGSKIGVLNVYRGEPGAWSPTDVDAAEVLGIMGTGYILHGYQQRDHLSVVGQLRAAIDSRDLIGQAKGILMSELDVDAETAFQVLRERSQRSNQKLRDVARRLVDGHRPVRSPDAPAG